MRKLILVAAIAILILGAELGQAQAVRSHTTRSYSTRSHHGGYHGGYRGVYHGGVYRGHGRWHGSYRGGIRIGVGWGGYYGYGGYGYGYRYAGPVYSGAVVLHSGVQTYRSHGPRFIHYAPRGGTLVVPPIEEVIPVAAPPRQPLAPAAEVVSVPEGATVISGGVAIQNIDGKIVIFQVEKK